MTTDTINPLAKKSDGERLRPGQIEVIFLLDHDGGDDKKQGEYDAIQIKDIILKEFHDHCNVLQIDITHAYGGWTEEVMKRKMEWHEKLRKKKEEKERKD
jgi:hypothetical protein